jgi:predicted nucleotidyltransferase
MVESTDQIICKLKELFKFAQNDSQILGVILYGSFARGDQTERSDIDVCIVAPHQNLYRIYQKIIQNLAKDEERLDMRFFEELPLLIRGEIVEHGIVLYTPDMGELTEYFFFSTRKELDDHRYMVEHLPF